MLDLRPCAGHDQREPGPLAMVMWGNDCSFTVEATVGCVSSGT